MSRLHSRQMICALSRLCPLIYVDAKQRNPTRKVLLVHASRRLRRVGILYLIHDDPPKN